MSAIETYTVNDYADVLKLLGDKTRLSILKILDSAECCVCHFSGVFDISQSAISQHIKKLREFGLVKEDPRKQWIYYSLNTESEYYPFIKSILDQVPDHLVDMEKIETCLDEMTCA